MTIGQFGSAAVVVGRPAGAVRRVGKIRGDEREVEVGIPRILPEIVLVQVVENAVLAASDEVASLGNEEDAGRAKVLI